jgi:hypothetical protein
MVTVTSKPSQHFRQGGRGVYTCSICQRRTRETTLHGHDICADCFELAGLENAKQDGCFTDADKPERDRILTSIVKKGGNLTLVVEEFSLIFDDAR